MIRRAIFVAFAVLLCLRAVVCAATGPAARPGPLHVILRTKDDLYVGHDLRYGDGTFRLRQEDGEARIREADVVHVTLAPRIGDWMGRESEKGPRDPVVWLAAHLVRRRRAGRRLPKAEALLHLLDRHVFYIEGEQPAQRFAQLAPRVTTAELVAAFCVETFRACAKADAPQTAADLFAKAEQRARGANNDVAFTYALMRVAVLMDQRPVFGRGQLVRQLAMAYPKQRRRLQEFVGEIMPKRPGGPRPPFGPGMPPDARRPGRPPERRRPRPEPTP